MARLHRSTAPATFSRAVGWGCLSCAVLIAASSCSKENDSDLDVPSARGAVQPDPSGALLSEGAACTQLTNAESRARSTLGCPAVTRTCPDYLRPAGGADCFQYSQGSIVGCADLYASFVTCAEFDAHPCLVSAVDQCELTPEPSGEGGASGASSTVSEAGSAGGGSLDAGAGGA